MPSRVSKHCPWGVRNSPEPITSTADGTRIFVVLVELVKVVAPVTIPKKVASIRRKTGIGRTITSPKKEISSDKKIAQ